MRRKVFRYYERVGVLLMRMGVNKHFGPKAKEWSDRLHLKLSEWTHRQRLEHAFVGDMRVLFPQDGYFGLSLAEGTYEPWTTMVFKQHLQPGLVVVDVGAHIGHYTLLAAKHVGARGFVYSFEPDPNTYSFLEKNVILNQLHDRVVLAETAVGASDGTAQLFKGRRDPLTNSIFANEGVRNDSVTCSLVTIDSYLRKHGEPSIDLMKIDVEGAEYAVLTGMRETSARSPRMKLIVEFMPSNLRFSGCTANMFFSTLQDLGFSKFSLILADLESVNIPDDVERIVQRTGPGFINLFCEKN